MGKERGGGQRGRGVGVDGLYSPGSKGTTLDSLTPFLDHTQLALLSNDTDDRTTLYGNQATNGMKSSPKGSSHSQLDSYSVSIDDHQSKGGEGDGARVGAGVGAGEGVGEDSWVDESYMTWTNTAMHLIQSGDYFLYAPIYLMYCIHLSCLAPTFFSSSSFVLSSVYPSILPSFSPPIPLFTALCLLASSDTIRISFKDPFPYITS